MNKSLLIVALLFLPVFAVSDSKKTIKFKTRWIEIGDKRLEVEIADTPARQQRGLMFRRSLAENRGMLFIFGDEKIRNFWMKNTFVPLSIGFFNMKRELVDIQYMKAVRSVLVTKPDHYRSKFPAKFALEVNKGWFKKNNVGIGTKFRFVPANRPEKKK